MNGARRKAGGIGLVAALAGLWLTASTSSVRADDCCGDLEERIADLETTTARKGNRKVSVTVSGWVNEAIFAWDDGTDSDVYIGTNFVEQSRFRVLGEAKIDKTWSVGYLLEIGIAGHPSNQWNQDSSHSTNLNPVNRDNSTIIRKSNWFVKNKELGQVAVGLNAMATYHLLDDSDPTLTRNVNDVEGAAIFLAAFRIRVNGNYVNNLRWSDVLRGFNNLTPGDSARRIGLRYDSPEIAHFTASAFWGEDDMWDVALQYKNTLGDFSLLTKAGYGSSNFPGEMFTSDLGSYVVGGSACISGSTVLTSLPNFECNWGGIGATLMHDPTGLFVYGGWGQQSAHTDHVFPAGTVLLPTSNVWFVQPGIEKKWIELGKTNIFGEYRHDDPGSNPGRTVSASIDFWQGGIIQQLEKADTTLYLVYQLTNGEVTGNAATARTGVPIGTNEIDAFQEIIAGAKINF